MSKNENLDMIPSFSSRSEQLIARYCPNLHALLVKMGYSRWEILDTRIENQLSTSLEVKTNFFRLLIRRSEEDTSEVLTDEQEKKESVFIKSMIQYIDNLTRNILETFPKEQENIWQSLNGKFDNLSDWNFLNPIGELAALTYLINNKSFKLLEIESPFPNGRSKDYLLEDTNNLKQKYFEVLNIHIPSDLKDASKIKRLLVKKIKEKITHETKNITDPLLLESLVIVPVVWYLEVDMLRKEQKFFENFERDSMTKFGLKVKSLGFFSHFKLSSNTIIFKEVSLFF